MLTFSLVWLFGYSATGSMYLSSVNKILKEAGIPVKVSFSHFPLSLMLSWPFALLAYLLIALNEEKKEEFEEGVREEFGKALKEASENGE